MEMQEENPAEIDLFIFTFKKFVECRLAWNVTESAMNWN